MNRKNSTSYDPDSDNLDQFLNFKNKNILITGASSGIGRACAVSLSKLGANIIMIARNTERLREAYHQLTKGKHQYHPFDISQINMVQDIVREIVEQSGKITGFVHSAGMELTLPFRNTNYDDYKKIFDVNVFAGLELARQISRKKNYDESGSSFVFISSIRSILGKQGNVAYCGSKGALNSACRALALELAKKKIRVNTILPGIVKTKMTEELFNQLSQQAKEKMIQMYPLGLGETKDVVNACIYLLSNASRWVTGSQLIVDGGYSIE